MSKKLQRYDIRHICGGVYSTKDTRMTWCKSEDVANLEAQIRALKAKNKDSEKPIKMVCGCMNRH